MRGFSPYPHTESTRFSNTQGPAALDNALEFFSRKLRSVRRSSGGLVLAEPVGMVLFEEPGQPSAMRVKVRFKDLSRTRSGEWTCLTHTKVVAPDELMEPFSLQYEGDRAQAFALDFGKGIIPVHVFACEEQDSTTYAYFLETRDADALLTPTRRHPHRVFVYRVEQSVLRWLGSADRRVPSLLRERALRNYLAQVRGGWKPVPDELRAAEPVEIPAGVLPDEVGSYLRMAVRQRLAAKKLTFPVARTVEGAAPTNVYSLRRK